MPGGIHPPFSVILSWTPNYVNPENRGWGMVILVSVLLGLCYIVVGMRIWARFRLLKNSGIDDVLIVFNLLPLTGLAISLCLAYKKYGFDKHVWDSPIPVLVQSRQITIALEAFYLVSSVTTKISILLFYRRLTEGSISTGFRYAVYAAITFVLTYFVVFVINLFIGCRPFNAFWRQVDIVWNADNMGKYHCFDEPANMTAAAIISVIQDFIACGMPMILFWKLRLPRKQKIAMGAIFAVGFLLCICGILRIYYARRIYYDTYDMTWESQPAWIWFAIESHVAVICASVPSLKVFFKHALEGTTLNSNGSSRFRRKKAMDISDPTSASTDSRGHRSTGMTRESVVSVASDEAHFPMDAKTELDNTVSETDQAPAATWYNDGTNSSESQIWVTNDIELGRIEWQRRIVSDP